MGVLGVALGAVADEEGEPSDLALVAEVVLGVDAVVEAELFLSAPESVPESARVSVRESVR